MSSKKPEPYTKLDKEEMVIYDRIWAFVEKEIGVYDVDNFVITMAAQKLNMAAKMARKAKKGDSVTEYRLMSNEAERLLTTAGLTPKMRKELGLLDAKKKKSDDPLAEVFEMKKVS